MWNHGYGLYPELVHVPIVISHRANTSWESKREPGVVSLLDLYQTICELANIDTTSRGINILETRRTEPVLTEYHGLLSWHYDQLRRYGISETKINEFDSPLNGTVDTAGNYGYKTHEAEFIAETEHSASLKQELKEKRSEIGPIGVKSEESSISEEMEDQLRNLGYM